MELLTEVGKDLMRLLYYSDTGNEALDEFVFNSSWMMEIAAIIGVLILILANPRLREHKRTEDRFLFAECILVIAMNLLDLSLIPMVESDAKWTQYAFEISLTVNEALYMLIILQWLVFVDYSLYRSMDHIRRRYGHAVLPIIILTVFDILESVCVFMPGVNPFLHTMGKAAMYYLKFFIELGYIVTAIYIVKKHDRESREPKFLRLEAFIIPFILGLLVRFYDSSMMALGIILTYGAVKRRDRFINHATGFYNVDFFKYLGAYRDKKKYRGESVVVLSAPENAEGMALLLNKMKPGSSSVIDKGDGKFFLFAENLRESAASMISSTFKEEAQKSDPPFTPEITVVRRREDESAAGFADRVLNLP